ncbi:hypothetical protein [Tsukamurella columbiensis]|uniref:Uncharacterized protein n=1 Tax=Tsukamurella columbiensis TaxID=128509 RepID=A0ABX1LIG1_9ACTN|nr:hypothetical protein [Tsukamurella columbiensis]NMD58037.1 hypothetical protein [Tsukamurella columbiensis]
MRYFAHRSQHAVAVRLGLLDVGAGLVVLALVDDRGVGRRVVVVLLVGGGALVVVGVVVLERAGGGDVGVSSCGTMTIGGSGIATLTGGAAGGGEVMVAVTVRSGTAGGAVAGAGIAGVGGWGGGGVAINAEGTVGAELDGAGTDEGVDPMLSDPGRASVECDSAAIGRSWADSPQPAMRMVGASRPSTACAQRRVFR